jgi:uncharacterized protein YggE
MKPTSIAPPALKPAALSLAVGARRVALAVLAVLLLTVVYLVGVTRSGASASTGPAITSSRQPGTIAGVGGAGGAGITVGGTAYVAGTPDTLRLDLSVVASAPSVGEALARANGTADAAQRSLLGSGVAKKDLQTSGLSITPGYDYAKSGTPRLTGYEVSEGISARLGNLSHAGDVIGKAVGAGGDAVRVNGISLDLEDTGSLVSRARDEAFADARTKAGQYARAAGRSLGEVVSIAETVATPSPVALSAAAMAKTAEVPLQPGSQNVSVTVTVVYALR